MIKRVHLWSIITLLFSVALSLMSFGKFQYSSGEIIFLVHFVVTMITILLYVIYGWNRFIGDYVGDKCHLKEYENLLYSKKVKTKSAKNVLRELSFFTGRNAHDSDPVIETFIQVEKAVLSGNKETISEQTLLDLKQTGGTIISEYACIIELIMKGYYQDALNKLDRLRNKTNMIDIPRQFYTAYILDKIGVCEDEIKSCISFLINRGQDTRYLEYAKQYINKRNIVENDSESKDLLEIPRFWIVFVINTIWIVLLNLFV